MVSQVLLLIIVYTTTSLESGSRLRNRTEGPPAGAGTDGQHAGILRRGEAAEAAG
jgi:hypothetical protein